MCIRLQSWHAAPTTSVRQKLSPHGLRMRMKPVRLNLIWPVFSHVANPSSLLDCSMYHHLDVTGIQPCIKTVKQLMPFAHLLRFIHWNKGAWLKQPRKSTVVFFFSLFWLLNFKHLYPGSFKAAADTFLPFVTATKRRSRVITETLPPAVVVAPAAEFISAQLNYDSKHSTSHQQNRKWGLLKLRGPRG